MFIYCDGVVGCNCNILSSIEVLTPNGQFLDCVTIGFSEQYKGNTFKNRVLRKILGPQTEEITDTYKKLHNEEFRDYSS